MSKVPQAKFSYDLSPVEVVISYSPRRRVPGIPEVLSLNDGLSFLKHFLCALEAESPYKTPNGNYYLHLAILHSNLRRLVRRLKFETFNGPWLDSIPQFKFREAII